MAYSVCVRRQHPNGEMRRDGVLFITEPTFLDKLTPGLERERDRGIKSWFVIEEASEAEAEEAQRQGQGEDKSEALALQNLSTDHLDRMKLDELKARATALGLPPAQNKKALVAAIFSAEEAIRAATSKPVMIVPGRPDGE